MPKDSLAFTVDIDGNVAPAPRGVQLKLAVVAGPDEGVEVPLDGTVEIGADPACGLRLSDRAASRKHATVSATSKGIVVKDLGSKNGTSIAGVKIGEATVPMGTVLVIGKTHVSVQARFHMRQLAPSEENAFGELLGRSLAMREVFAILERVAPSHATVLVEGESGTGKELVGRSIHAASPRSAGPLVVFHCGAVPSELAESELFGHKKGAFSGATSDRQGAFQRAHGGTIVLDELGELPLDLQPKLLRVLESGEVRPVGEDVARKVDVRVVASTNRDLHAEVQRGRFRPDLYYRLEVVRVRIPPLRIRPDDVPLLVEKLLAGRLPPGDRIEGENLARLVAYAWPGNVRELKNVLERAVTLGASRDGAPAPFAQLVLDLGPASSAPSTLGVEFPGVASHLPYKEAKAQLVGAFDRAYVAALLERNKGNILRAAQAADISRKHLYELLEKIAARADDEDATSR
jgi:DNA-binding NtrC family response regulator